MAPLILLALLVLPFVEIAVFIRIGALIGVWPTIALMLLSTFVGAFLMRYQGLATLVRARQTIERNESPVDEMLDGLCILLAGAFLIVPGFVTDALGLLLFVPWGRRYVRRWVWRGFESKERRRRGATIETDYVVIEEGPSREARPEDMKREPPRLEDRESS